MSSPSSLGHYAYREVHATDAVDFGAQLCAVLNEMAYQRGELVQLNMATIAARDGVMHVGHVVVRLPLQDDEPARTPTLPASGMDA